MPKVTSVGILFGVFCKVLLLIKIIFNNKKQIVLKKISVEFIILSKKVKDLIVQLPEII